MYRFFIYCTLQQHFLNKFQKKQGGTIKAISTILLDVLAMNLSLLFSFSNCACVMLRVHLIDGAAKFGFFEPKKQQPSPKNADKNGAALAFVKEDRKCELCCTENTGDNFPEEEHVILSVKLNKINKRGKSQQRVLLLTNKAVYNLKPKDYSKCQRRIEIAKLVSISSSTKSSEFALHVPEEYDYRYRSVTYIVTDTWKKNFVLLNAFMKISFQLDCECAQQEEKNQIITAIETAYFKKEGKKLHVNLLGNQSVQEMIVTKDVARVQVKDICCFFCPLFRYIASQCFTHHYKASLLCANKSREDRLKRYRELLGNQSVDDEVADAKKTVTGQLMETKEKVSPNDFDFLKVIGRGSFGKVMQVKKKDTGEIYAMKILKKKALIQKGQVEHTNAERMILQSLQHPFLMHLRYAFQTEAKLYFVLDYYRGGELFFHLRKKKRFNEEQGRFFVAEVGMALGHLHVNDIVYRDLKPENILLDQVGHICLTDFGLSKELGDGKDATTFCGTPEYLAPEIVKNKGHGKAVDWWSLGILLYELTVGIPPFYSQNIHEMYRKIQEAPLLFPPTLSKDCKDVITQLLVRDPVQRLGSGKDDFDEIKKHAFFGQLDFDQLIEYLLYKKEIVPPYNPNVKGGDEDTSCFDDVFLKEAVVDSHVAAPVIGKTDGFSGFTYAPDEAKDALS
ncbi:hypothetical protein RFI_13168 [Reticulomyxa filosa]|uniref:non-specific serine/threonine protein kinase n=1 Tax=Reticulomyxa filosa TaxID=46433 RepID=X6NE25_RETFI|nr:hypothetical protein RFI_13168 [Reticulomyxa filosa]|eukprot:ETO23989.1 hypothetical protein RFI_13168 [Reticulomyxa filosa]